MGRNGEKNMNKTELIEAMAANAEITKTDAEKAFNAFVEEVTKALANGDKVALKGFGNFEVRSRDARTGRNPITGEAIQIAASKVAAFKPSTTLKAAVNNK